MSATTGPRAVGRVPFVDGVTRDVFEDAAGRQFVLDGDGDPKYSVWIRPKTPAGFGAFDALDDGPRPPAVVGPAGRMGNGGLTAAASGSPGTTARRCASVAGARR